MIGPPTFTFKAMLISQHAQWKIAAALNLAALVSCMLPAAGEFDGSQVRAACSCRTASAKTPCGCGCHTEGS